MSRERIVNQTKTLLKENFIELLDKKPLSKITIKELCERADINRTTYYRYYLDQYDQLQKIENELFIDISAYIYDVMNQEKIDISYLIECILTYIENNKQEFKVLLQKGDMEFQAKLLSYIGKIIFKTNSRKNLNDELSYIYRAQGSFGIVKEWIYGNIDIDKKTLTNFLTNIKG